jgi:predicted membrane protein
MSNHNNSNGRIWLGAILIIVGALIFLKNFHFNILNFNIFSWPFLLLIIGIIILVNHKDSFPGIVLVMIGGVGIASDYLHISFRTILSEYWPFMIIIFGIYLVLRGSGNSETDQLDFIETDKYFLDIFSIFGDKTKKIKTDNFLGGKTTSLFGDLTVDLKDCQITEGTKELDTLTMFGATEIFLPSDWQVIIKTTTIFGGFEDQRVKKDISDGTNNKMLIIKGIVLFGSGEIRI